MMMFKSLKLVFLLLSIVVMQACSTGKIVKGYEGDELPKEQLGLLVASDNISVISINGKEVPTYMLANLETTYGLKPGKNTVVFVYESLWATSGGKSKGGQRSEKVVSQQLEVEIEAKAGESYHFSFLKPANVREAKEAAKDLKVTVFDSKNVLAAKSQVFDAALEQKVEEQVVEKTDEQIVERSSGEVVKAGSTEAMPNSNPPSNLSTQSNHKLSNTDALKAIWAKMSAKEKKAFLVWAFQE